MDYIISVSELTKTYKKHTIVDDISFTVKKGEILGIVGPSGSGKTMILKLLAHLTKPSSGAIRLSHMTNEENSHVPVGALIEEPKLVEELSVYDNMYVQCAYTNVTEPKKHSMNLLKMFQLKDLARKAVKKLSVDERKRLGIAMAMVAYPPILLLDEPFKQLTPKSVSLVTRILSEYRKKKESTILIAAEILTPLQSLCDRFLVLSEGQIAREFKADELEDMSFSRICLRAEPVEQALSILRPYNAMVMDGLIHITYKGDDHLLFINRLLYEHNVTVSEITIEEEIVENTYPLLEDHNENTPLLSSGEESLPEVIDPHDILVADFDQYYEDDTDYEETEEIEEDASYNETSYDSDNRYPEEGASKEHSEVSEEEVNYSEPRTNEEDSSYEEIGVKGLTLPYKDSFKFRSPSFQGKFSKKPKKTYKHEKKKD